MENREKVTLKTLQEQVNALVKEVEALKAENKEIKEKYNSIILSAKYNKTQSQPQVHQGNAGNAARKYNEVEIPKDILTKLVLGIYKNSVKKGSWSQFDELSGKQIIPWASLIYVVNTVYGKELSVAERGNIVESLIGKGVISRHVYHDGRKAFVVSDTTMAYGQKVFGKEVTNSEGTGGVHQE